MELEIIITLFLVFLNGFFVAAEFAIVKVRISQIQVNSATSFSARIAHNVVSNLDAYLAATQLGITLASLALGWIGEDVVTRIILYFMDWLGIEFSESAAHKIAIPIAFTFITVLHIVFGELAPKSLAIRHPRETAIAVSIPLKLFYVLFRPFIIILNGFANFILRIIGIKPVPHGDIHSEDELKLIIAESAEGGAIEASERELIQNVFDFDDRTVKEVLKPRNQLIGLNANLTVLDAIEIAIEEGYSRYPVYEESIDAIIGFVHTKDLLSRSKINPDKIIREIVRPILFLSANKKILQVLRLFQSKKTQMAVVVNEFGGTIGLLTMEDIIEELVGEIQDEHDTESPIVEKITEHSFRIKAQNPIDEINEFIPVPFVKSESYVTLAGLILESCESIPVDNQELIIHPYQVKIIKMGQNSPEDVQVTLMN
ncbi:MAG: HlyC/CorC family transporter [Bacteroidetes bacterium]|nr:HlyC/CorC family transporter [Bacteroidota bacterium]